jgi:hypothetical protein
MSKDKFMSEDNVAGSLDGLKKHSVSASGSNDLLCVARAVKLPEWATHVAVSTVRNEAEPCMWLKEADDYIDENPENLKNHKWTGSYKHAYWKFFSREELNT